VWVKTVGIELWGGQKRGGSNQATVMRTATRVCRDLRELFHAAYPRFAARCREADEPGIAMIAVDETTGCPAGLVRVQARVGRHVAAIVGRHDVCDLFLNANTDLALRHLAVIVDPVSSYRGGASIGYRILDLRSAQGFLDEDGRALRGLRAEGPAVVRCAGYSLFALPLGDPTDWPADADDAWAMLPERVYFDELACSPEGSMPPLRASAGRSLVMRTSGVWDAAAELAPNGAAGVLEVDGPTRGGEIAIGDGALRDGVLLGRYARCDGAILLDDPSLSRVHVLVIHIEGAVLAIDTASRNGTRIVGEHSRSRVIALTESVELELGKATRLRWHWSAQ
jgi:hypothetical protein